MPKKHEHIYKRKDGRWEGRYRYGTEKNGKAIYHSVYGKNFYEAKRKLSACKESTEIVEARSTRVPRFKEAVLLWQKANANRYKGATAMKYENLIQSHILPSIGDYKLSEINTLLLAGFMNEKLCNGRMDHKGGLSTSYVRSIMLIVFQVMDFAANENMCPSLKIQLHKPTVEKKELEILDATSQRNLEIQLIGNPSETNVGILLSLRAGLRIGEVCALKWSDIDFKNAILHVRSTVTRIKNIGEKSGTKIVLDKPKTKSSLRDIPLSDVLMKALMYLYEKRQSEYVISDKPGFVSPRTYEYRFHRVLEEHHISDINYHALRHTFATRCIELGVDVKTLSELLGHSNVATTLNTYAI